MIELLWSFDIGTYDSWWGVRDILRCGLLVSSEDKKRLKFFRMSCIYYGCSTSKFDVTSSGISSVYVICISSVMFVYYFISFSSATKIVAHVRSVTCPFMEATQIFGWENVNEVLGYDNGFYSQVVTVNFLFYRGAVQLHLHPLVTSLACATCVLLSCAISMKSGGESRINTLSPASSQTNLMRNCTIPSP